MNLTDLANKYRTDKGTIGNSYHGFTYFYESFFFDIKNDVKKLLEIGIGPGSEDAGEAASLKMWHDYFPNSIICGADYQDFKHLNTDRIKTFICDQLKNDSMENLVKEVGNDFDIIIDDGGHNTIAQQTSFGILFPCLKSGGYYIIEDLHTSVWGGWGLPANDENSAYALVLRMQNDKSVETVHIPDKEKKYIKENLEFCKVYDADKNHITSIIKKL